LLQGNNWISDARVSPDGNQIALFQHPGNSGRAADDRGEVAVVDRSGRLRTLSTGWESLEGLAWTPSGKEVWFSAAESGEQYCIHATTLSGKQRTVYCGTSGARVQDIAASGRALVATNETQLFMPVLEHNRCP
jgi:DNA-binding beta-propeller fold protein YncE